MRRVFGVCCIILGVCCLIASVGLIVYNHWEEENAQSATENILQDVQENILDIKHEESISEDIERDESEEISIDIPQEMFFLPQRSAAIPFFPSKRANSSQSVSGTNDTVPA